MHFARLAGFDDEADRGAQAGADQMMMHGGAGQQRRDRNPVASPRRGRDRMMMLTPSRTAASARAQSSSSTCSSPPAPRPAWKVVSSVRDLKWVSAISEIDADLFQIAVGQDRLAHFQPLGAGQALAGRTGSAAAR